VTTSGDITVDDTQRRGSRRRSVLSGVALVLACLTIVISTLAVWVHQVAFDTDRFTALVADVVEDPALVDPISGVISTQVVDALDVEARIEQRLPDAAKPLAGALTLAVRDAIDKRLQVALANPRLQEALVNTVSFTHERLMNLLRDKSDAISVVDGYVVIEVFPVVEAALTELQSIGLIPADVQIPDLSNPEAPGVLADRLEGALGVTLPDTFGTIQLMPADRLLAAQSAVRAFDLIVIALVILSVVLVALAIWLAQHRRRMVVYLAVGTIIAFLLARLAANTIVGSLIEGIPEADLAGGIRIVVDATIADFRQLTAIILVATGVLAVVAYLWGRPAWAVSVAGVAGDTASRAGSAATAAGGAGVAAASERRPTRASIGDRIRTDRAAVERIGIAVIVFIVAWIALGLEIALVGAALVVGFEMLLRAIAPGKADAAEDPAEAAGRPAPDA